ncbi:amidase family protein [Flavobacteriaceae bacterium]|nr:amidase family protein [Flavobacteriaceae bacterium]
MRNFALSFFILILSCSDTSIIVWENYDESIEIKENSNHEISRMRYKRLQSLTKDRNEIFKPFHDFLKSYDVSYHNSIKDLIINQDITSIQSHISKDKFNYEDLVKFYLYRIYKFEMDKDLYLNSIISLNPEIINEAKELDRNNNPDNLLYGIPILVKDNINVEGMVTSAGASVFKDNLIDANSTVIKNLKINNALILGKLNMSEWAYYFCRPCPVGYSSLGGQTLNPYGRKVFESGGSSSGSGVSIAANFAAASIGSETSGSILSPSSKNSLVGLKPTIGSISRSGIVPISSFFDTSGPMTTNVYDNAILYNSMIGFDDKDQLSYKADKIDLEEMKSFDPRNIVVGISSNLVKDSLIAIALDDLKISGISNAIYNPEKYSLPSFRSILTSDMKRDLPKYISNYANKDIQVYNVTDIVEFNNKDTLTHAPYGQYIFNEIKEDKVSDSELEQMKINTKSQATNYLNNIMTNNDFDIFISVDNSMAGIAAAAHFPALTIPMGYRSDGQPSNITFIAKSKNEQLLYNIAYRYENQSKRRVAPKKYN